MPRAFLVWPRTSLTKCRPHGLSAGSDTHANNMLVCCPFSSRRCCKFLEQKQCRQIQTSNSFVLVRTRVQHTNKCTWGKKEICMSAMMDSVMRLKLGYSQVYSYLHCSKQLSWFEVYVGSWLSTPPFKWWAYFHLGTLTYCARSGVLTIAAEGTSREKNNIFSISR